jgi:hypothetical protein
MGSVDRSMEEALYLARRISVVVLVGVPLSLVVGFAVIIHIISFV